MRIETVGAESAFQADAQGVRTRVTRAAHEFEAQMMKELLKPMTAGTSLPGGDGEDENASSGALCEFASEALGKALSNGGGFGIAARIVDALTGPARPGAIRRDSRDSQNKTVMDRLE